MERSFREPTTSQLSRHKPMSLTKAPVTPDQMSLTTETPTIVPTVVPTSDNPTYLAVVPNPQLSTGSPVCQRPKTTISPISSSPLTRETQHLQKIQAHPRLMCHGQNHLKPHLFKQVQLLWFKTQPVPFLRLVQVTNGFAVITQIWMPVGV